MSERGIELVAKAIASGRAKTSYRGRTVSIRFGTDDIRDLTNGANGVSCVRVYEDPVSRDECGHKHRDATAAMKCARSMATGEWSQSRGESWVEILPFAMTEEGKE